MPDKLMNVEEVAEYLRVKPSTVYEWAKQGNIPTAKVGRLWRFERDDIEAWVKSRKRFISVEASNNEVSRGTSQS